MIDFIIFLLRGWNGSNMGSYAWMNESRVDAWNSKGYIALLLHHREYLHTGINGNLLTPKYGGTMPKTYPTTWPYDHLRKCLQYVVAVHLLTPRRLLTCINWAALMNGIPNDQSFAVVVWKYHCQVHGQLGTLSIYLCIVKWPGKCTTTDCKLNPQQLLCGAIWTTVWVVSSSCLK